MNEQEVRQIVEQMYQHVAAFPWTDTKWRNNPIYTEAAKEQIVGVTVRALMELEESRMDEERKEEIAYDSEQDMRENEGTEDHLDVTEGSENG